MTQKTLDVQVAPAAAADLDAVIGLLEAESLPIAGVREHFNTFFVASSADRTVGCIGLELYDDTALLRSAVVNKELRGSGLGSTLLAHVLAFARKSGIRRLLLLTNTAEEYFHRRGFRAIPRNALDGPVTRSVEFTEACPASAVCMEMML